MGKIYVCTKGCRVERAELSKIKSGSLRCAEHGAPIDHIEILCADCRCKVILSARATRAERCGPCNAAHKAYVKRENRKIASVKEREKVQRRALYLARKGIVRKVQDRPAQGKAPWPGKRPVRKTECAAYQYCFELVDYGKHNAKMNCGICACFQLRSEDPADYVTGEVCR